VRCTKVDFALVVKYNETIFNKACTKIVENLDVQCSNPRAGSVWVTISGPLHNHDEAEIRLTGTTGVEMEIRMKSILGVEVDAADEGAVAAEEEARADEYNFGTVMMTADPKLWFFAFCVVASCIACCFFYGRRNDNEKNLEEINERQMRERRSAKSMNTRHTPQQAPTIRSYGGASGNTKNWVDESSFNEFSENTDEDSLIPYGSQLPKSESVDSPDRRVTIL